MTKIAINSALTNSYHRIKLFDDNRVGAFFKTMLHNIKKHLAVRKRVRTFVAFKQENVLILGCVVFFLTTSEISSKGFQPQVVCCTSKVSKCSLAGIGEESLLLLNKNFNLLSQCKRTK